MPFVQSIWTTTTYGVHNHSKNNRGHLSSGTIRLCSLSLSISTITEPFKNPRILSSDMDPDPLESAFNQGPEGYHEGKTEFNQQSFFFVGNYIFQVWTLHSLPHKHSHLYTYCSFFICFISFKIPVIELSLRNKNVSMLNMFTLTQLSLLLIQSFSHGCNFAYILTYNPLPVYMFLIVNTFFCL